MAKACEYGILNDEIVSASACAAVQMALCAGDDFMEERWRKVENLVSFIANRALEDYIFIGVDLSAFPEKGQAEPVDALEVKIHAER